MSILVLLIDTGNSLWYHLTNQTTSQIRPPHKSDHLTNQTTSQIRPLHKYDHLTNQTTSELRPYTCQGSGLSSEVPLYTAVPVTQANSLNTLHCPSAGLYRYYYHTSMSPSTNQHTEPDTAPGSEDKYTVHRITQVYTTTAWAGIGTQNCLLGFLLGWDQIIYVNPSVTVTSDYLG